MKTIAVILSLFLSTPAFALVGLPDDTCRAIQEEEQAMRTQARTGEPAGDTEISAGWQCEGPVPWAEGAEQLSAYWNKCADVFQKAYDDNCT